MGLYFIEAIAKKKKTKVTSFFIQPQLQPKRHKNTQQARPSHQRYNNHFCFSTFTQFFLIVMLQVFGVQADIAVTEYGVRPVQSGDTALVFYANASHTGAEGSFPIAARLQMEKCCLMLSPDRTSNCDSMKLISGLGIILHPKQSHTLLMYFVNYDLYDREGSCVLNLLTKSSPNSLGSVSQDSSWNKASQLTIDFKTRLPQPSIYKSLYSGSSKGYRICNSDNYNALHECSNYNDCLIRYTGARSLFSQETQECMPTPECNGDAQFLSIYSKKCEKVHDIISAQKSFSFEMKLAKALHPGDVIHSTNQPHHFMNLQSHRTAFRIAAIPRFNVICVHGVRTIGTNGLPNCTCHSGWRSLTLEEWTTRGGVVSGHDDGLSVHRMCTVDLVGYTLKDYIILTFVLIAVYIPFAAVVLYNRSRMADGRVGRKKSGVKAFLEEEGSSGDDDDDSTNNSNDALDGMEEDEADKVISEIANRREPQSQRTSFKDFTDDNQPPPPPSSQTLQQANTSTSYLPAKPTWRIPLNMDTNAENPSQEQKTPPPSVSPSATPTKISKSTQAKPAFKLGSTGKVKGQEMGYYSPSRGFDLSREESEMEGVNANNRIASSDVNRNNYNPVVATHVTSTDDLLSLSKNEKINAHQPISPNKEAEKRISVVVANCSSVQLLENNVFLHTMSSEEITQRKKQEWEQFIKSVSKEDFSVMKPPVYWNGENMRGQESNNSIISGYYDDEEEGDDDEMEVYSKTGQYKQQQQQHAPDFTSFHKDDNPKAVKVKSVPEMMQYHPFSSFTPPPSPLPEIHSFQARTPEPPPLFVQKAFANLSKEELLSRQECYNMLSSMSSERVSSVEGVRRTPSSIWSNVAAENTSSAAAASFWGKSRFDDDENMALRTRTIYGDIGSDADSDGALEEFASTAITSQQQQKSNGNKVKRQRDQLRETVGVVNSGNQTSKENLQLNLESDNIPSDVYISDSDAGSSTRQSSGTGLDFWKYVMFGIGGGSGGGAANINSVAEDGNSNNNNGAVGGGMSPETTSAYRIKSSLESMLKASRTRSSRTNLF